MAGAALLTEDDEDFDELPPAPAAGQVIDLPQGLSDRSQQARRPGQEPNFEVVETDDYLRPTEHPQAATERRISTEQQTDDGSGAQDDPQSRHSRRAGRSAHRREYIDRLKTQVAELSGRVDQYERVVQGYEPRINELDQARHSDTLNDIGRRIEGESARKSLANQRLTQAIADGDSAAITAALEERDAATSASARLQTEKERLEQRAALRVPRQPDQQFVPVQPRPTLPPAVVARIEAFQDRNPWYTPHDPGNVDSQVILSIDRAVASEGFDPRTDDYWDEIEERAAQYLPQHFGRTRNPAQQAAPRRQLQQQQQTISQAPPQRRGPPIAGGSDRSPGNQGGGNKLYLSPGRKQALMAVGALDSEGRISDREKFNKYAAKYAEYDRDNPVQ